MNNRERQIDDIVTFLSLSEPEPHKIKAPIALGSTKAFTRLIPTSITAGINSALKEERILYAPVDPADYPDFTSCGAISPGGYSPDAKFSVFKAVKVNLKEVRGARLASPYVIRFTCGLIRDNGTINGSSTLWNWNGREWIQMVKYAGYSADLNEPNERTQARFSFLLQTHEMRKKYWMVELGFEGMPTIDLLTSPAGAKAVFRLRDVPEGRQRRAALKHWVSEHWRQSPSGEDKVKVTEYLRGAERFVWNGMICNIRPSAQDLQKLTEIKQAKA